MADLSQLVQYDVAYPVHLEFNGERVGIRIDIVSFDTKDVAKVANEIAGKRWAAVFENEDKKLKTEQVFEFAELEEQEKLIAAIKSWDFGGNSFGDLGVDPECTEANKRYLVCHQNSKWIRDQLKARAEDLGNFTQAPAKPSKKK